MSQSIVKYDRISQSAEFVVNANIKDVFPLFGPIREKDWADGWEPQVIYSKTNLVEQHMIFETKSSNEEEEKFIWAITQYRPEIHLIEYTVSTPNRIWFITVTCQDDTNSTRVNVTYTYTSLNEKGKLLNEAALKKMFVNNLRDWEQAVNHYLKTGTLLK